MSYKESNLSSTIIDFNINQENLVQKGFFFLSDGTSE